MDTEILKLYFEQTKDIQTLKEYFDRYNSQVQEFGGGGIEIDTSHGLVGIIESIDGLEYSKGKASPAITDHWCRRARDSRHQFCKAVLKFFGETDKVPEYNAKEVVKSAEKMTIGHVADSFYKFASELCKKSSITA